jgi:TRAP-type C4-dicarboxylate transport system permease small subunit
MPSELLLAAVISGSLGALVLLAALVSDIRGPKKRVSGDTEAEWPKAA